MLREIEGAEAYKNLKTGFVTRTFRIPSKEERAYVDGCLLPKLSPKFRIEPGERVFTIGSCFAREVERVLLAEGFIVPVAMYTVDQAEFAGLGSHLLNEYNAGTILQRFESLFDLFSYEGDMGAEETEQGFIDLFLHIHSKPVSRNRLLERRREIKSLYMNMKDCDTVILTMGLVECWYDARHNCYLNKAPSQKLIARQPGRYFFHQMDVENVFSRLAKSIDLLNRYSKKKILVTLSPIPIEATFTGSNAIMANSYSKSVLRIVAEQLHNEFDNVDYFPSYEIATSAGLSYFELDNIHLKASMVTRITDHMLKNYCPAIIAATEEMHFIPNYVDNDFKL